MAVILAVPCLQLALFFLMKNRFYRRMRRCLFSVNLLSMSPISVKQGRQRVQM
ncbi:hypothetical protein JG687_00008980 [Phytophthora cactorum]|uniref:Uncharacterized protein n=1 Tax=Phytophthora cactorum TaxID=29920 RepID=A0A8T1UF96_9STRA|nr:hypothetical protein JG687_00008980 [Phytophthora cactorum]